MRDHEGAAASDSRCLHCRHLKAELDALRHDLDALKLKPNPALQKDAEGRGEMLTLFADQLDGRCAA